MEELERKVTGSDSVIVEDARSVENLPDHVGEDVRNVLSKFKTHSITTTNELFFAGAVVVANRLGMKIDKVVKRKEPIWKTSLQNKIKELRKDVSQLEASKDKYISNFRHCERS